MQQTEKYQLNLIDPSDEFSPDPLNANARAVEAQFLAVEAAEKALDDKFTAADAAIQKNLGSGGKTTRIASGSYVGDGTQGESHAITLTFDFQPYLVLIMAEGHSSCMMLIRPRTNSLFSAEGNTVSWADGQVKWYYAGKNGTPGAYQCNMDGYTYHYTAFGETM